MSSKSKLITAIVLLAVGAGLIPTGLVTNDYLRDQVYDGVPEAMLKIKADAVPGLEDKIPVLGLPDILKGVFDLASAGVEPLLKVKATPDSLLGLKAEIEGQLLGIINFATLAQGMAFAFNTLNVSVGPAAALDTFFNNATYADPYISLPSIAMIVTNLSYSLAAAQALLFDGIYDGSFVNPWGLPSNTVMGILEEMEFGTGASNFYTFMGNAWYWKYVIGPYSYPMDSAMYLYNATEAQLLSITAGGYMDWAFANWVPGAFAATFGITVAEALSTGFYRQWANATFFDDGIDIGAFLGISELKGFEVGLPDPTNISIATCIDLWNVSHPLSFTNENGLMDWLDAGLGDTDLQTTLMTTFSLTPTQLTMIITWLSNFIDNVTPALVLDATGQTVSQLATLAFYEQWANGTIFGEVVLPDGFLGEIDASFGGAAYFEIGLPSPSGLSLAECINLWDVFNDKTFFYGPSFTSVWLPALMGGPTTAIETYFLVSAGEAADLVTWLRAFADMTGDPATSKAAMVLAYDYGQTITQIATAAFYEQWSNGTINGDDALPDGFLAERVPPIYGPPYFEIGLSFSATLTLTQCAALWNVNSEYSLVTVSGIHKWYKAAEGNTMYTTLATQNGGLNFVQMGAILEWLPVFRDVIVNILAEDDKNLPMEPYDLGQTLAISLGAGGGALAALGVVLLILSRRS
ncbi:MAG: hypothetical protein KGD58_04140 [Candidatus Lokiarchaeota archaeon]|nr:hypothetical protein [Candidatus Lokiarchaeota archaeon]